MRFTLDNARNGDREINTHRFVPLLCFPLSISCIQSLSFQVGGSYAIAFLDTDPPETMEVFPRLLAKFLDSP